MKLNKLGRLWLACLLAVVVLTAQTAWAADTDTVQLQVLTVNDFHGALVESGKNPGAAKLGGYLKARQAANPKGTLILSAGDMFQGSMESNLLYGKPVVEMMNDVGFDAMALGNHEFDWGVERLQERIKQSHFPYLAANIKDLKTGQSLALVKPYVILQRLGVKVAVIGLTTPETAYMTSPKVVAGYLFEEPAATVKALLPELKAQGVNIILVLGHMGSFWDETQGKVSGEAASLAESSSGLTAIVSGHTHQLVKGSVNGVGIIQAAYNGRAVGDLTISYDVKARQVIDVKAKAVPLVPAELAPDLPLQVLVAKAAEEVAPVKQVVLGRSNTGLFHDRTQPRVSPLGQWTTDVLRQAGAADIALQNCGGLRTSIAPGNITMGSLYEILPFDNTLYTMDLTGDQVREVLEYGIMNKEIGMLQFSGLTVTYDSSRPEGERVVSAKTLDGKPLEGAKLYRVATNDFMAMGGDKFNTLKQGKNLKDSNKPIRDILAERIKALKIVDVKDDGRLRVLDQQSAVPAA